MDDFGAFIVILLCLLLPACVTNNVQKSKWEEDCKTMGMHRASRFSPFQPDTIYECKEKKNG